MVDDAASMGCECVKFQCHVIDDEMVPNDVIPGNADESIWDIMSRCALTEQEEIYLKDYDHEKDWLLMLIENLQKDNLINFELKKETVIMEIAN